MESRNYSTYQRAAPNSTAAASVMIAASVIVNRAGGDRADAIASIVRHSTRCDVAYPIVRSPPDPLCVERPGIMYAAVSRCLRLLPPPEFQHQQRVESLGMVGLLRIVIGQQPVDHRAMKMGCGEAVRRGQ
jgi:hypothetical protein